jgi:hypothetical protein
MHSAARRSRSADRNFMGQIDARRLEIATSSLAKAIFDPAAWPEVMDEICKAVGATGAVLLQSEVRTSDVPRTRSVEEMVTFYFNNNWHTRDLRGRGLALLLHGEPVFTDHDIMTPAMMRLPELHFMRAQPCGRSRSRERRERALSKPRTSKSSGLCHGR